MLAFTGLSPERVKRVKLSDFNDMKLPLPQMFMKTMKAFC